MRIFNTTLLALALAWAILAQDDKALPSTGEVSPQAKKPNVIVILTDDQDLQMESMKYLDGIKKHLTEQGTFFNHHYCTVALCCPSRANMLTGKAAHNTNITDLRPPFGGYPKFINEGLHKKWLPVWLQKAGYKTYYTGKLMNSHDIDNYRHQLKELSLDGHDFMIDPGTYQYLNTTFQHNEEDPKSYPGEYATDLLSDRSMNWIDEAATAGNPFFLMIAPVNPHANSNWDGGKKTASPPIPAKRHENAFAGLKVPRTANFNPDVPSGASWLRKIEKQKDGRVDFGDYYYRRRLQALLAVDDLVNATIDRLDKHNILDNTYIIYTSDNGFHIGQHRLTPGKRCPYEEDVNVPLVIRGPGIPKNQKIDFVTTHTDIVPTILNWAGADGPKNLDGVAIPTNGETPQSKQVWEHAQIEHWGQATELDPVGDENKINTYKALRVIGKDYDLYYAVWCEGDHEIYDMKTDSQQMHNLYGGKDKILGVSMEQLESRLDAMTLVLKTCEGKTCYDPWSALHPGGDVNTLIDALAPKFDNFYVKQQHKVKFDHCSLGYFTNNEQPLHYLTYGNRSATDSDVEDACSAEEWETWRYLSDSKDVKAQEEL